MSKNYDFLICTVRAYISIFFFQLHNYHCNYFIADHSILAKRSVSLTYFFLIYKLNIGIASISTNNDIDSLLLED
jgi:hypothetical protein